MGAISGLLKRGVRAGLLGLAVGIFACGEIAGLESPNTDQSGDGNKPIVNGPPVEGTPAGITVTPKELDLGTAACGQASKEGAISIKNDTNTPVEYEAKLPEGQVFTLRDGKGTIPAHDVKFVYVGAKPTTAEKYSADVVIKIGSNVSQVAAKVAASGGALTITPSVLDFGDVRQNTTSAPVDIDIKNAGSDAVTIESFPGLPAGVTITPPTIGIPAGQSAKVQATFKAGAAADPAINTKILPKVNGAICGNAPSFDMRGKAVNQDVTVTPLSAPFGDQPCTRTPTPKPQITISNYDLVNSASFTATLLSGANSRFTITPTGVTTVNKAVNATTPTTQKITISAKQVGLPLGNVNEQLEVKTTSQADGTKTSMVALSMLAFGAIIELTPATPLSGFAPNETKAWQIKNTGNNSVDVVYGLTGNGFSVESGDFIMASEDLRVTFTATNPGTYNATVTWGYGFFGGGPFCNPPPTAQMTATRAP
jgi:hypothetical protein